MTEEPPLYHPTSDFLMLVLDEEVPLSGSALADANLAMLIGFTTDADKSNRDWAIFLLSQSPLDSPDIRAAFKHALGDEDEDVRAEALVGIAKREPAFALPLVADLLVMDRINDLTLEAAGYVADPELLPALQAVLDDLGEAATVGMTKIYLDDALDSCATGIQSAWRDFDD